MLNEISKKDDSEIKINKNVDLSEHSTMFVGGEARFFVEVNNVEQIGEVVNFAKNNEQQILILGGGSNTIISDKGFDGLVIKIKIKGLEKINETDDYVDFNVGAGEEWDDLVKMTVDQGLYGIENMSRVPGTVGASVIQNIGCYGQEAADAVLKVDCVDVNNLTQVVFSNEDMNFSYRRSRLNDPAQDKGKYIVTQVTYRFKKQGSVNCDYGDVNKYLQVNNISAPDLQIIRKAIIEIRDSKFPYPDRPDHGSCGSFFNAETVDQKTYEQIIDKLVQRNLNDKADYLKKMQSSFKVAQGYKIPYGVLIESLGFKGKMVGGAKVLETHAGVIFNATGKASATDVYNLAEQVIGEVLREYGVKLRVEPELVGEFN